MSIEPWFKHVAGSRELVKFDMRANMVARGEQSKRARAANQAAKAAAAAAGGAEAGAAVDEGDFDDDEGDFDDGGEFGGEEDDGEDDA